MYMYVLVIYVHKYIPWKFYFQCWDQGTAGLSYIPRLVFSLPNIEGNDNSACTYVYLHACTVEPP